ncbi:MAG TPA: class I SAM-dependent methyltransferase, partial [Fimbriimonadaceae bacterium]|nr:class I SAM-dependent methyltransferase [Fimbriimonadaceae bacterium]
TSGEDARWAFGQWALRHRARAKFALADRMLFDRESLEMASHEAVATYHASRFPRGEPAGDLTCGTGADLIALARRGPAIGFELDRERAAYARHNLAVHGLEAEIVVGDAMADSWPFEFAYCDPSRRIEGRRTLDLDQFSPSPREVAERFQRLKLAGMKLSPMLQDRDLESFGARLEFVSYGRECREALLWFGFEAGRVAVRAESGENLPAAGDPPATAAVGRHLFEADPAAIRAHGLGTLCARHELFALGDSNGYLTGDSPVESVWLTAYEVLADHAADLKRSRAALASLGGGTPVVKSRGAPVDVDKLRKNLRGEGEEFYVVVYPIGASLRHAICRKLG